MKALIHFLLCLFLAASAHAKDERNLAVNQVNNAVSDKRIALVIGNSAYANSPLKNPVNDAKDMAAKLRALGFDVIERSNLQTKQIGGTLREFRSKLAPGAVALVFYAGHGLQIKGDNYLPAVDADINSEEDVPNQSLAVRQIMDVLDESRTRLNLVFLDACRNNPYASRGFRSAERGLARVSAPSGTLISYATKPGSVAADGDGRNGLYTSKLLAQMDSTIQVELTLKRVVTEVKAASQGKQEPWMEGSIEGDFCFGGCITGGGVQAASLMPVPMEQVAEDAQQKREAVEAEAIRIASEASRKEQLNEKRVSTVTAILHNLIKNNSQTLALSIQKTTHPTGNSASLNGYDILPQKDHISVRMNVVWRGGLLQGNQYQTTVSWELTSEKHVIAKVVGDTAAFAVAEPNKQALDQYFRNNIYPIFYSSMQQVSYMWKNP